MVFAINSDESSQRNFSAFAALAKQLNGTSALAAPPSSPSNGAAALDIRAGGVALTLVLAAAAAILL
jgi:hypothetical protein